MENKENNTDDMYDDSEASFDLKAATILAEHIALETDEVSELKAEHTRRTEELKQARIALYDLQKAAGMTKFTTESGLSPSLNLKTRYARNASVSEETLFGFLEDNKLGDIIKRTVNYNTLNSTMNEYVKMGGEIPLTDEDMSIPMPEGDDYTYSKEERPIITSWEEKGIRMNGKSKFVAAFKAEKGV
jgi:hypothetical protein